MKRIGILAAAYVVGVVLTFIAFTLADAIFNAISIEPIHVSWKHRLIKALVMSATLMAFSATLKWMMRPFTSGTAHQGPSKRT